ncbi:MAG: hypothetical protein ABIM89_09475 [Mycobacteriales bacterium]
MQQQQRASWKWVAAFALAVIVGHHVGTIAKPLGGLGDADWADWIDVLVPYVVLSCAAMALRRVGAGRSTWVLFAIGAVMYTQGHGIHLAANSIANVDPGERAHLWDEVVGHYVWYAGWVVVVAALGRAMVTRETARGWSWYVVAALYGLTWMTNTVEGGTPVLGLIVAVAFTAWGALHRDRGGRQLMAAYGIALALLLVFGVWQRGFPQFTELGWI